MQGVIINLERTSQELAIAHTSGRFTLKRDEVECSYLILAYSVFVFLL